MPSSQCLHDCLRSPSCKGVSKDWPLSLQVDVGYHGDSANEDGPYPLFSLFVAAWPQRVGPRAKAVVEVTLFLPAFRAEKGQDIRTGQQSISQVAS